jgi:TRAP-type mannitol/chloroaromatic compound transport system substrate-binding protein
MSGAQALLTLPVLSVSCSVDNKKTRRPEETKMTKAESAPVSRRKFLKTGAVAAGVAATGTVAMPNVSRAQTVSMKFQSTWPNKDIFHEYAADYVTKVNEMGGGRLRLELLPAGSVVPAFQMLDAVNTGILDGGHGVSAYWYGKHKAFSLFGTAPAFGWDANQLLGWVKYGGGQQLYDKLTRDVMRLNVVGFLTGPMPTQPLGWFRKEITGPDDIRGMKFRTVGLGADLFKELGAAVTILPGGEIVPALDRGLIEGAEFNNPSSDRILGFPDVSKIYMVQSYHQALECFEILFNKGKYDALPKELQAVLKYGAEAASADMSWKAMDRYSKDMEAMKAAGVKVIKTPDSMLKAQLAAWDKVIANLSKEPMFAEVIASQKAFAKRVVSFFNEYEVTPVLAYEHFYTS